MVIHQPLPRVRKYWANVMFGKRISIVSLLCADGRTIDDHKMYTISHKHSLIFKLKRNSMISIDLYVCAVYLVYY